MRQLLADEKIELPLTSTASIRVYADCRPHAFQTRKLQKGGVLVVNGRELVEEGLGFGFPVCLYEDGARFSLSALTFVDDSKGSPSVTKIYDMNAIESKRFRGTLIRRDSSWARLLRTLEKAYRGARRLHVGASMMLNIVSMLGLRNDYVECGSKGHVSVRYGRNDGALELTVNFEHLVPDHLLGLMVGNEQGGAMFTEYSDPVVHIKGREIEPWRPIPVDWAKLGCPEFDVSFNLRRPDGWRIIRGREEVENRVSWSGLNLMCDGVPSSGVLRYNVEILESALT